MKNNAIFTESNKKEKGEMIKPVSALPIITDRDYRHALTAVQDRHAYLMPIDPELAESLTFKNGILDMRSFQLGPEDYRIKRLTALDFPLLRSLYGLILHSIQTEIEQSGDPVQILKILENPRNEYAVALYMPDLFRMLGVKPNQDGPHIQGMVRKLQSFNSLIGMYTTHGSKSVHNKQYAVMLWHEYNSKNHTVRFSSPYLNHIAKTVLRKNMWTNKNGHLKFKPSHSYMLCSQLASERNKRAVEILSYIDYLIETAGTNGEAHAKASTIIHECPELEYAFQNYSSTNRNLLLKRAFGKAWELMQDKKYSNLCKKYKKLRILGCTPTASNLDMVFSFPHEGKEA